MPIYAYRCNSCGHAQDVLQKMSDPVLTVCPVCNAPAYAKQLTAAGFQLKGSGWYVTDFRGGNNAKPDAKPEGTDAATAPATPATTGDAKPAATPAGTSAPAPAADKGAAPAPSSGAATGPASAG